MRPIEWMGSSKKDLREFPDEVKDVFGRALLDAQFGDTPKDAKPLKGFGGTAVMEIVERHEGDTFRAVYTAKFGSVVYVLHAFQKKSKKGIATPKQDIALIQRRLAAAEVHYRAHYER
jgi:phage-related protein